VVDWKYSKPYSSELLECPRSTERRILMLGSGLAIQIAAGVLAAAVLGIIVYRRKQKAV
jgi:type IV secretory pathway TrbD component